MKNTFLNTIQLEKKWFELGSPPLETIIRNSNNYLREDRQLPVSRCRSSRLYFQRRRSAPPPSC